MTLLRRQHGRSLVRLQTESLYANDDEQGSVGEEGRRVDDKSTYPVLGVKLCTSRMQELECLDTAHVGSQVHRRQSALYIRVSAQVV